MNLFDLFSNAFRKITAKPTPADFRRGVRKHRIVGYLKDFNSKHPGMFKGGITPIRNRFKGVSRTAGRKP